MLLSLKIENYALIRSCRIDFDKGFTVITGETGSGKTIIMGALQLVLGARADTQALFDKDKKCSIEASFNVAKHLKPLFEDNDLDYEPISIFTREILPSGKTRIFINDTPTTLNIARLIGDKLVDIHSQSSTIHLKDPNYQLQLIDMLIEDKNILSSYRVLYAKYNTLKQQLEQKLLAKQEDNKTFEYNQYIYNELVKAKFSQDNLSEQEQLEQEIKSSKFQQLIKDNISESLLFLDNKPENVLELISKVNHLINKASNYNPSLQSIDQRLSSLHIELKDIVNELYTIDDNFNFSPEDIVLKEDRLSMIYDLERKHNVSSIEQLLAIQTKLSEQISLHDNLDEDINTLQDQLKDIVNNLDCLAKQIHNLRQDSANKLVEDIMPLLSNMKMQDSRLEIRINSSDKFLSTGKDSIDFRFSANKTIDNQLLGLKDVISGGELSRLMLAIKAVVSKYFDTDTMIFDEIDTGISGDIASKTADIMLLIAQNAQVIAITHLVQMASKANNHYKVYKQTIDNITQSQIQKLSFDKRVEEIAKMISSDNITSQAIETAKQLLNNKA